MANGRRNNVSAKWLKESRTASRAKLGIFTDERLEMVAYRFALSARPDGYKSSSRAGEDDRNEVVPTRLHDPDCPWQTGDCICGATPEKSSTTESTALRRLAGSSPTDPQRAAVVRIVQAFQRISVELKAAEHALEVIEHAKDGLSEWRDDEGNMRRRDGRVAHDEKSVCLACLRQDVPNTPSDRLHGGYCESCHTAWRRWSVVDVHGQKDRIAFEAMRRAKRSEIEAQETAYAGYVTGYTPEELDALVANGTLPQQAAMVPDVAGRDV